MDERRGGRDPDRTARRVEPATSGRGARAHLVEILRPAPALLAHDPAMIAGFESLSRRVLLQAFEDAAQGDGEARAFLTKHEYDGLLAHWVRQAGLTMPLATFRKGAVTWLKDPERVQALFGRLRSSPVQPPHTQEDESTHE